MAKTKILLVEDDKSLREIYGVRLYSEGYDIVSAGDGEEALAIAIKERPPLIISDVMMPKISGFDMLDILRSTTETKNIKVIMMTALSSEDQRQRGQALGADRYLVKSQVGIEDVVRTVHEVLGDAPVAGPVAAPSPVATAAPAPAPTAMPAPAPATYASNPAPADPAPPVQAAPTSALPQPTAPFSTARPASLGDRVIHPLTNSEPATDFSALMNAELGANQAPPQSAPAPAQAVPVQAFTPGPQASMPAPSPTVPAPAPAVPTPAVAPATPIQVSTLPPAAPVAPTMAPAPSSGLSFEETPAPTQVPAAAPAAPAQAPAPSMFLPPQPPTPQTGV